MRFFTVVAALTVAVSAQSTACAAQKSVDWVEAQKMLH
jgi:hypothetical protein